MISTLKIENRDLVLDSICRPTVITSEEAIQQTVEGMLEFWKGEYFRDSERGVNWIRILGKGYNRAGIIQEITRALLKCNYITRVIDISIKVNDTTRTGEIYYTVVSNNQIIRNTVQVG